MAQGSMRPLMENDLGAPIAVHTVLPNEHRFHGDLV